MDIGCTSEVGQIQRLLLKHPREAFLSAENIRRQWQRLNYKAPPDYEQACKEYDFFASLFEDRIREIHYLPSSEKTGLDSIYVHDSSVLTQKGVILPNMGKRERTGEPKAVQEFLKGLNIPVLGSVSGKGRLEGGDVVLWDERTLIVGHGYRTNEEGIRQLKQLLQDDLPEIVVVSLPHWEGPGDVMHLMSLFSPVDYDLAVVYSRLLPVSFRNWLVDRSVKLIEVSDSEFGSMGCNILTVAPRRCIMIEGNPLTRQKLLDAGVEVWEYSGKEISVKGSGGPTCLTRPLLRID
ncbi:MAG: arginine deiminase family protein [Candidatus Aminicenantes bacterium]